MTAAPIPELTTDHQDGIYQAGENIVFKIAIKEKDKFISGQTIKYTVKTDGQDPLSGTLQSLDKPLEIIAKSDRPGFVSCNISISPKQKDGVWAAVEPLKIKAADTPPEDFDYFWNTKLAELNKTPISSKLTPVESPADLKGKVEIFDVKINCPGTANVSGVLIKPVNASPRTLAALVRYHEAGVKSAGSITDISHLLNKNILVFDINAHGIENAKADDYYVHLKSTTLKDYQYLNSDDREKCYFPGMFLRAYRAMQFMKTLPEWNKKDLIAYGGSQGGAQALAAAALDPQVNLCIAYSPALSDQHEASLKRSVSWPAFLLQENIQDKEKLSNSVRYFDIANFAHRIKARTITATGLKDFLCPPSTIFAAYNNITAPKEILVKAAGGHDVQKYCKAEENVILDMPAPESAK